MTWSTEPAWRAVAIVSMIMFSHDMINGQVVISFVVDVSLYNHSALLVI